MRHNSSSCHYLLYTCARSTLHAVCLCTWRGHGEQHRGGLHPCVCAEGAAVETTVFLHHTCQVQANIQAVRAADPAPVAVVLGQQAPIHLLAHSDDAPGVAVRHLLQNDLVHGAVVLVVTADGEVVVLLGYQLCVRRERLWGGGLGAVVFFRGLICEHRKRLFRERNLNAWWKLKAGTVNLTQVSFLTLILFLVIQQGCSGVTA